LIEKIKDFIEEYFLILFLVTALVFIILGTVVVYNIFTVKSIIVKNNFNVNEDEIIKYLDIDIEDNRFIWSYDTALLEEKLLSFDYFHKYSVEKKYPDTLVIEIKNRDPIATIVDDKGVVSFIDTNNVIFRRYSVDTLLPLIVYNGENLFEMEFMRDIKEVKITNNLLRNIIKILSNLNISNRDIFDNISQIELSEKKDESIYSISFRNNGNRIYFKNYINYNLIVDSFISSLFLLESGINSSNVYYTGTGFVYR